MRLNWKKAGLVVMDIVLGAYLIMAFTAFNKPDEKSKICTKVNINIQDESTNGFINAKEIKNRLEKQHQYPLSKKMININTRQIEESLKRSAFVKTAECYKTQDGTVCITLTQRMPIVRIKSVNGDDYYVDDKNSIMPNSHYTSDLIINTGYVSRAYAQNYIAYLANTLMENDFWKNQIEQINVTPDLGIELVPRVGNHIVYIGQLPKCNDKNLRGKEIKNFVDKKLNRLRKFYLYGLSQAGWNKYSYINLEFDNQIICKKRSLKKTETRTENEI